MKKIILLFLFVSNTILAQLNLTGEAFYKLDIIGYQNRDPNGCGDIDGLRQIKATRANGTSFIIWSGRKLYEEVNHNITYTKNDPITNLEFYKIVRWENWLGNCDGGPNHNYDYININNTCFSSFQRDAGSYLNDLTVTSKPHVKLNGLPVMYLGDTETLNITLPDNIDSRYFVWKYKVGSDQEQFIPNQFNNSNILNLKGSDFLTEADFGKTVSVWVEMNCDAGAELAKGYAKRNTSYVYNDCRSNCSIFNRTCITNCFIQYVNTINSININPPNLEVYQSKTSNAISFTYLKSAPKITNLPFQNLSTSCSYNNDGRLKLFFDRPTIQDEILKVLIKNTSLVGSDQIPYNVVLDANDSFEISNLAAGMYELVVWGSYQGNVLYSPSQINPITFEIKKPAAVDFNLSKVDVWCHGGNDGSITIEATGGNVLDATANGVRYYYSVNNGNWMPFSTETSHTLSNLVPGPYTIKVRDFKSCYAKTAQNVDKEDTEEIYQPTSPVSLTYTQVLQPTFYGGTNGRLVAAIQGGTRFPNNSYQYEWRNSSDALQTNVTASYDAGTATYYLTLNGIPSDTYTLTVRDKNFSSATNQVGCTVANSPQFLGQPDPIVVTLQVTKTISCHVANSFGDETDFDPTDGQRDESQDGIILATVTGGVPFTGFNNNGLPYKYYWKKQAANGTWVAWNDSDETAENLSHGNYALNVEDKNGIRLGVYVNNVLDQETPKIQFIQQPDKFELTFQKGDITCSSGSNGWLTAVPTGGTAPYFYEWTTGATTAQITNLIANNYFVKVTDSKGCIVQGSSTVEQPNGVAIQEVLTNPTCTSGSDGSIQIDITGGTLPYLYTWSTGQTTKDLTNLTAGNYTLTLEDGQGCIYYKDFVLTDPAPIVVNLGNDRTLCNGQNLDLDVTISDALAQYSWTSSNGFTSTSPVVSLTNSGTYQCKVTSSKGCEASDTITISTSNVAISSEFFLSSQAYLNEEVVLVNTSNPLGQNTIWDIPNTVTIVSQNENYIVLKFPAVGSYTISLKQTQGDCYAIYSKLITVEPKTINASIGNTSNPFISEFTVSPNPSSGDFSAIIKLEESSPIKLRLYALSGQVPLIEKYETGQKNYVVPFSINLAAGTYALILETAKQTLVKKIIIY